MLKLLFHYRPFVDRLCRFTEEKGVTAPEYALMLGLVALAIAIAVPNITDAVMGIFDATSDELNTLSGGGAP